MAMTQKDREQVFAPVADTMIGMVIRVMIPDVEAAAEEMKNHRDTEYNRLQHPSCKLQPKDALAVCQKMNELTSAVYEKRRNALDVMNGINMNNVTQGDDKKLVVEKGYEYARAVNTDADFKCMVEMEISRRSQKIPGVKLPEDAIMPYNKAFKEVDERVNKRKETFEKQQHAFKRALLLQHARGMDLPYLKSTAAVGEKLVALCNEMENLYRKFENVYDEASRDKKVSPELLKPMTGVMDNQQSGIRVNLQTVMNTRMQTVSALDDLKEKIAPLEHEQKNGSVSARIELLLDEVKADESLARRRLRTAAAEAFRSGIQEKAAISRKRAIQAEKDRLNPPPPPEKKKGAAKKDKNNGKKKSQPEPVAKAAKGNNAASSSSEEAAAKKKAKEQPPLPPGAEAPTGNNADNSASGTNKKPRRHVDDDEDEEEVETIGAEEQNTLSTQQQAAASGVPQAAASAASSGSAAAAGSGVQQSDETQMCVICLDEPKTHVAFPCGHQALCGGCANTIHQSPKKRKKTKKQQQEQEEPSPKTSNCPVCRETVLGWAKVFT